jgi:multidrug resistance efflux pump
MGIKIDQRAYLAAFEKAQAECGEVVAELEKLRIQRMGIEKVVEALKPLIGSVQGETRDELQGAATA